MSILFDRLNHPGVLVADGATGTMLQRAGLPVGTAPVAWNLGNPDAILALHQSYIEAGSDMVLTNTFGANQPKLDAEGLGEQAVEINLAAARLARVAAGSHALVLGDIGPTGKLLEPLGPLSYDEAVAIYAGQVAALVEGGVNGIWIETMSDLNEAKAAVEGAKRATQLPVLVSMSFDTRGRTMMGVKPAAAARELWSMGVTAIGANCGRTLSETLEAVQAMRQAVPEAMLIAKPNAGLPHLAEGGESVYDVTPEVMADYALKYKALGVKVFGGCCGSTPDHIRAIALTLHA
jgi:methionine synthase I (cobalamin-dependent)